MPPSCPPRRKSRCPLTAASVPLTVPDRSPLAGHRPSVGSDGCATDKLPRSDGSAGESRPHLDKSPWAYIPECAYPVVSGQRRMWCRSAPRPSFPRTPIELQQCFRLPRRQWQRFAADEAGEAYLAECPLTSPDGRFPPPLDSRPRRGHAKACPLSARRLRGCASCGFQVSTAAGTALHRTRTVTVRHWLESPTGGLRGLTGDLRGPRFLRPTRRVRATGRIESSPALPGASRVRPRRS
jgi:hypothetical protein